MRHFPVFLACNDKFAPFAATTIASFCDNTKDFIDFYILDSGISPANIKKLTSLSRSFKNFQLQFVKTDCNKEFTGYPEMKHITKDMYSRFLIPDILPDCPKAVYSDVDVIATGDIADLFATDLGDKMIAAVPEYRTEAREECLLTQKRLKLDKEHQPFNSGLLLIDCQKWNERNIKDDLIKVAAYLINANTLKYPDQDILNKCFHKDYLALDRRFCVFPKHLDNNFTAEKIKNIKEYAVIFHFAGGLTKPWLDKTVPYADEFWKYARMTDFFDDIKKIHRRFVIKSLAKKAIHSVFSVTNRYHNGKKQKAVVILGIKITV